jgi:putative colanic acid biosynthesis glycosyltransferase WcaI
MRIQLWSYNYDPEPTGIGPVSTTWARAMRARGHDVEVVAAHPHYPTPAWGRPLLPRREVRDGIHVLRLPLWAGRANAAQRIRQELTHTAALSLAAPTLGKPDVIVAVSPSFPALAPAMAAARLRRIPWVLWLQDILPDAATATGLLEEGPLVRLARRFEIAAYRSARRVVVISDSFAENLAAKGVPASRIVRIYNPASLPIQNEAVGERAVDDRLVLTMGNIAHTQNLVGVTRAFESSSELAELGARFVIAGDGHAAADVRAAIATDRVTVTGILNEMQLQPCLRRASVALVSQQYEGRDVNVPSKLMNFMGFGLPTVAAVRPDSEVARILVESSGGWVTTGPDDCARQVAAALRDPEERRRRGERALAFARHNFTPSVVAERFEHVLSAAVAGA